MSGARPAVMIGTVALALLALITLAGLLRGAGDTAASSTEPAADAATEAPADDPATEAPPAPEEQATEPAPETGDEPAGDGGFSLPGVSLPDPSEIGAGGLGDVVSNLPGAVVGERREDLASGLENVADANDENRPQEANELLDQVTRWVADGELNQQVGGLAEQVLRRLATG